MVKETFSKRVLRSVYAYRRVATIDVPAAEPRLRTNVEPSRGVHSAVGRIDGEGNARFAVAPAGLGELMLFAIRCLSAPATCRCPCGAERFPHDDSRRRNYTVTFIILIEEAGAKPRADVGDG